MHYLLLQGKNSALLNKNITCAKISKYLMQTKFLIQIEISQFLIKRNIR